MIFIVSSTLSSFVYSTVSTLRVDMSNKWNENSIGSFYGGYFVKEGRAPEEEVHEYLDDTQEESTEDEYTEEDSTQVSLCYAHTPDDEEISEDFLIEWGTLLRNCLDDYEHKRELRSQSFRTIYTEEEVSYSNHNLQHIWIFCDTFNIWQGAYYLCELYHDSRNIHKNLSPIYQIIAEYELSNEEILLLLSIRLGIPSYTRHHISWDNLAQLLDISTSIPSVEEFRCTLRMALEKQQYNQYINFAQLFSDFNELINTQLYY